MVIKWFANLYNSPGLAWIPSGLSCLTFEVTSRIVLSLTRFEFLGFHSDPATDRSLRVRARKLIASWETNSTLTWRRCLKHIALSKLWKQQKKPQKQSRVAPHTTLKFQTLETPSQVIVTIKRHRESEQPTISFSSELCVLWTAWCTRRTADRP